SEEHTSELQSLTNIVCRLLLEKKKARWCKRLFGRACVDVREANLLHGVEVVQIAPVLLEAVRRRQRGGVVTEMVLAKLTGGVPEIEQELGNRRCTRSQIGWAARKLRRD